MEFGIILTIIVLHAFNNDVLAEKNNSELSKIRYFADDPKIINGTEADWHGTRHQVSIRLRDRDWYFGGGHICGGSLIADDIVLTAGHCIWNYEREVFRIADEFSIVMGNLNRYETNNTLMFNVSKISMLPTFVAKNFTDDIAIMFLNGKVSQNFTFAKSIQLNKIHDIKEGTICEVSGWGLMETKEFPEKLMVVDVAIINRTVCSESYNIINGMICAGYLEGERDACQGDSGGPLKCGNKLVGIVSYGFGCAVPNYPGVYTEVANYIKWINEETGLSGAATLISMNLLAFLVLLKLMFDFNILCNFYI